MNERYQKWLNEPSIDKELHEELKRMDARQIEEAFYKDLTFGTGGMRGILGAGTNRMNIYTVAKAAYGYGKFLLKQDAGAKEKGVAIAFDNRHKSAVFARTCVSVLAALGIRSYLFESLRPTPLLSYAVRKKGAAGGIMVTASHNPPNYNGVKMYDSTGCQLVPFLAAKVIEEFNRIDDIFAVPAKDFREAEEEGLVDFLSEAMDAAYIEEVKSLQLASKIDKTIRTVFTPLHGTAALIGKRTLEAAGYTVDPVESQMIADPDFTTVDSPNPENEAAFAEALKLAAEKDADLLIATDPDADRLGLMCKHEGDYRFLTGNQTGAIFLDYILKTRRKKGTLPENGVVFNTIVTSVFGATIARHYGMEVVSTLTGFKFIGEQMHKLETESRTFVMGYEESYGYVLADFVRDKDAIQAMLLAAEITNVLKQENRTLVDYLESLYETYGYYLDHLMNIVHEGKAGEALIEKIMDDFRQNAPEAVLGKKLIVKEDYQSGKRIREGKTETLDYPKSNVLKFIFEDDIWFVLRPSGTEPKLKVYLNVLGETKAQAETMLEKLKAHIQSEIETIENR